VDDLAANRTILQAELAALGLDSSSEDDPATALEVLRGAAAHRCPFTCVLLDYRMPGMSGIELARAISADPLLAGTPLILLASGFEDANRREAQVAGIGAILDKPVRRAQLIQILHRLSSPASATAPAPATQPDPVAAEARRRRKLLVVEDSAVNQRVAVGLLDKLGFDAEIADNGLASLDMLDCGEYAAVLMDCLMPEMDGYTATQELRAREAATGRPRIPVIALTASARPEDRQRCLDSGMDDFLSKPIRGANLEAVLSRWVDGADQAESTPIVVELATASGAPAELATNPLAVTLDLAALRPIQELEGLGRSGLFDEMLELFRQEGSTRLEALRSALASGDADRVYRLAHAMKGEAMAWGATDLIAVSRSIEEQARDGRLSGLAGLLDQLARLFEATLAALDAQRPRAA
jgi:CheY-like chemotaxis protein